MESLLRFSGGDEYRVEGDRERRRLEGGEGSLAVGEAAGDWGMSAVEMSAGAVASGEALVRIGSC